MILIQRRHTIVTPPHPTQVSALTKQKDELQQLVDANKAQHEDIVEALSLTANERERQLKLLVAEARGDTKRSAEEEKERAARVMTRVMKRMLQVRLTDI